MEGEKKNLLTHCAIFILSESDVRKFFPVETSILVSNCSTRVYTLQSKLYDPKCNQQTYCLYYTEGSGLTTGIENKIHLLYFYLDLFTTLSGGQ